MSRFHKLTDYLGKAGIGPERVEVKILKLGCWILNWMAEARGFMEIFKLLFDSQLPSIRFLMV